MKKKHHILSFATLALALGMSFSSCNDSCVDTNGGKDNNTDSEQTDKEYQTRQELLCLLGMTADVDSLPDNWNSGFTSEPTIGQEASEGDPYVRLVATSSVADACRYYQFMTSQKSDGSLTTDTWTRDGIGTLKFTAENQSNLYATVDVDVKQLPHLTQIRFVPASALGNNDASYWYSPGDIIKQENPGEEPTYWMCVRPCIEGSKGRSHWCSFQLNSVNQKNPNFAEFEGSTYGKLTLPTKLAKTQGDAARMIHLYFNELLLLTDPTRYDDNNLTSFGELELQNFKSKNLRDLKYMWDDLGIWSLIAPTINFQDKFNEESPTVYVFYYGYNRNIFTKKNTTYLLNLASIDKNNKSARVFCQTCEAEQKVVAEKNKPKDFSTINANGGVITFSPSGESADDVFNEEDKKNVYVVKHRTAAQLENRWLSADNHPESSMANRNTDNHISDVFVQKQKLSLSFGQQGFLPFFACGDEVVTETEGKEALCLCDAIGRKQEDDEVYKHMALFLAKNGESTNYVVLDQCKYLLTLMMDSYFKQNSVKCLIQPEEQNDLYEKTLDKLNTMLSKMGNLVQRGKATDNNNQEYYYVSGVFNSKLTNNVQETSVKRKFTLKCYPATKADAQPRLVFEKQDATDADGCVNIITYSDTRTYTEDFSKKRTLIATGQARRAIKSSIQDAFKKLTIE